MTTIVVAGLSVRALAESAREGGFAVVGLDAFGDRDTRAACRAWHRIGAPDGLRLDAVAFSAALAGLAFDARAIGWVPGSGFEDDPTLLDAGGDALPCFGLDAARVRRVRSPATFFAALDRHGIAHPAVARTPPRPADAGGWLAKRAGGCGGTHVRPAADLQPVDADPHTGTYWQRFQPGTPMSALFLADGESAAIVGLNRQRAERLGALPFVHAGAIGPVADDALHAAAQRVLDALVPEFDLRGLMSLDFIVDDDEPGALHVLELNPRPSASLQLHGAACEGGLLRAHLAALGGELPRVRRPPGVRGWRVVFARHALVVDAVASDTLAALGAHDVPPAGTPVDAGAPLCSVSAVASTVDAVEATLQRRAAVVGAQVARLEPASA